MADKDISPKLAALQSLEASLHLHRSAQAGRAPGAACKRMPGADWRARVVAWFQRWTAPIGGGLRNAAAMLRGMAAFVPRGAVGRTLRKPAVRMLALATLAILAVITVTTGALWWRLTSGPISLDLATPWLTAAIKENLGSQYQVEIGGTVIELDENRRMAIRVRDLLVRDRDGAVVAIAPKAEAGFSGMSLFTGRPRAESLSLVGAELALRIEADGKLNVFAGADKRAIASSPILASAVPTPLVTKLAKTHSSDVPASPSMADTFAALLTWIDSLGSFGLDGGDLAEVGLKSGSLVVDDVRSGRQTRFENIHLSLTRPQAGELALSVGSQDPDRPWLVLAALKPISQGLRAMRLEARKVSLNDLIVALRLGEGQVETDLPMSASLSAEIGQDGMPQFASGRMLIGPGMVGETGDPTSRVAIDRMEASLEWDATRRALVTPFQIVSGRARMTLIGQADAPRQPGEPWAIGLRGGSVVVAPVDADDEQLLLNRIAVRCRYDPVKRRLDIQQADIAGMDVGLAMSGNVEFASSDPRIAIGIAARNMSASSFKQLWPAFVNPAVRSWVMDNMSGGSIDRLEIATNALLSQLKAGGPPVPDDGLSIEVVTSGTQVKAVESLPPIRDADLVMRVRGRSVSVALGRGSVELPSGRRLTLTNGLFEVPDTFGAKPPVRVRARADGPVPAAAEFLALDRLRETSGAPLDPATSRGTVSAQLALAMPLDPNLPKGAMSYNIIADVTNFAVDRFVMSQRIEAQTLRITANNQGYQLKGDVRIGGTPANVEYRKGVKDPDAEVRLQAVFDDAARSRFGFDLYGAVTGPIPIKLGGRIPTSSDQDVRFAIEADLTQAKIDNLLPSWAKPAGKPARAAFTYVGRGKGTRFEDLVVEGSGAGIKGAVEIDANGDIVNAAFPVFGLSDGDKASLRAERAPDGVLKIVVRGDVYDGRAFVKSVMGGTPKDTKPRNAITDLDIDAKIGALAGFNGEALRGLDLKMLRRGGRIENFGLSAKIGVDTPLLGDLRGRVGGGGQVVYVETNDAGALFRFTDTYARMFGGQMWVAMDPPTADHEPKEGLLNVRDFTVRGEPTLDRMAAGNAGAQNPGVDFTRMRVDFVRSAGRLAIRDGVVRGPVIGATIDGLIDYAGNEVRMRGTFVPLYGLNNAFGQIPIVGLFLGGGSNEGLVGVTYEVVGTPGAPLLRVNPISAVAPGVLRKFFEFPSSLQSERLSDTQR